MVRGRKECHIVEKGHLTGEIVERLYVRVIHYFAGKVQLEGLFEHCEARECTDVFSPGDYVLLGRTDVLL